MADAESFENLLAARNFLKMSLEKSRYQSCALEKTGTRLRQINRRLPSLLAEIEPIPIQKGALAEMKGHIDLAIGPAAAILNVFNAVHGLENMLLLEDPCADLAGYLTLVKRYEEGLRFLTNGCRLVIPWLEDLVDVFLRDEEAIAAVCNGANRPRLLSNLNKSLRILRELAARKDHARCHGGPLSIAFDKLQIEFRRHLKESSCNNVALAGADSSPTSNTLIDKLEAMLDRSLDLVVN